MQKDFFKIILVAVIIAAVLASCYLLYQRSSLEEANKQVELALLYDDVKRYSAAAEKPVDEAFADFAELGATGILFKEQSLSGLFTRDRLFELFGSEDISVISGRNLINNMHLMLGNEVSGKKRDFLSQIKPGFVYLMTDDSAVYERMANHLKLKVPEGMFHIPDEKVNNIHYIGLSPEYDRVFRTKDRMTIGIGFPEAALEKAADNDLNVLVQISSWPVFNEENFSEIFDLYRKELEPIEDRLSLAAYNDAYLPGFPAYLQPLARETASFEVPIGFIEPLVFEQVGIKNLGSIRLEGEGIDMSKRIARLHAISAGEMATYSTQRAVDRFSLAVSERNIRVMLVRLFPDDGTGNIVERNQKYIEDLAINIEAKGFSLGQASTFDLDVTSETARNLLSLFIGMGVIAGGLLLLDIIRLQKLGIILAFIGSFSWLAVIMLSLFIQGEFFLFEFAVKLMGLSAVIIFPTLAVTAVVKSEKNDIKGALRDFLKITAVSLCGALLMAGLFSHLHYMLGLDQFAGVKLGLILPIILIVFIFYFLKYQTDIYSRAKELLEHRVTVLTAVLVIGFGAVIGVLLLRSDNIPEALAVEEQLRFFLHDALGVRPRTKEFLIGHPIMILLLYLGYSSRTLPLLMIGMVGQVSLVNTFAHIHTPFLISLIRTGNGLLLGIISGIILITLYYLAVKWREKRYNEKK